MLSGKRSDSEEFHQWLDHNKEDFKDLNPAEIAYRAIVNGFNPIIVRQWEVNERFRRMDKAS